MLAKGLDLQNLSFGYGAEPVLKDVTFTVDQGRFCALLGPNGAGKTSLFSLLTRLVTTPNGSIEIAGVDLRASPRQALAKMGIVFQQMTLDLDLSVRRNLSYYAALRGISGKDADMRIDAALERLDLMEKSAIRARDLNGGHRRRTEIARALLHDPEILLLDEPTVGLDPASRAAITEHVHSLCAEDGLTVLWATHLVDEVRPDDDLVILHRGEVHAHDTASRIAGERTIEAVFLEMTSVVA
jgi:ABC-2 type transport system ATP-binding protein